MRRAMSLNSAGALSLRARTLTARSRLFSVPSTTSASRLRSSPLTSQRRHYAFHTQLENNPGADTLRRAQEASTPEKPQTLVEKIVQKYADGLAPGKVVRSGDYVTIRPHKCMTHDNTAAVLVKAEGLGLTKVNDPSQLVFTADHSVQDVSPKQLAQYAKMESFARGHGIWMSPPQYGIGHQIMVEEGFAWPQTLCVASDSHSNHYGGVGCLGTPVVRTDAVGIWSLGKFWWQVPPVVQITLTGLLPTGVTGKDVIVALCGLFGDAVLNSVIELQGSEQTLNSIPIEERLPISNMSTEFGALGAIFPVDDKLISWYRAKATMAALGDGASRPSTMFSPTSDRINHARIDELVENRMEADTNAVYAKKLYMNLSTLSPFVSGPNSVKVANPLSKLEPQDIEIQKAYLVSCTNSRASDIASAARVFREAAERGEPAKIHPNVQFYMAAASTKEQRFAEESGDWQILVDAGAKVLPSGCGPCIGLGAGLMEEGETAISASNRNFVGRMGSPKDTYAYLGSPEVVAASAIQGKIAGPNWYEKPDGVEKVIIGEGTGDFAADQAAAVVDSFDKLLSDMDDMIVAAEGGEKAPTEASTDSAEELTEILPGFPEKIEGEILFCDQDQMNTDGIYAGKYTYQPMTTEAMAEVCMENYDPDFGKIAKPGDILVGGSNWGTGSSREQAATSLLAKKIPLVVAASFGNIFSRNSINNALMGVEVPKLVERLREAFKDDQNKPKTRRTGWKLTWDVRRSKVIFTEADGKTWEQKVGELPPNFQEIASEGLEAWIKAKSQA